MTKQEFSNYSNDLLKRQFDHLSSIYSNDIPFEPCQHSECPSCIGTGVKADGSPCIHEVRCTCMKCSPYYFSSLFFPISNTTANAGFTINNNFSYGDSEDL